VNNSIKNVFSFIKETLELKNKNIYDVNNYEKYYDLSSFYNNFKDVIGEKEYKDFDINSSNVIFKLKYIKDDQRKKYPEVPTSLSEYIYFNENKDLVDKINNLDEVLEESKSLSKDYDEFLKDLKDVDNYNELVDKYNQQYMDLYNIYKRINDLEEKIEVILGTNLLFWKDGNGNYIKRHAIEANLDMTIDPINNSISLSISQEKAKGFVMDFFNMDSYKVKDYSSLSDFVKKYNESDDSENNDLNDELKKYLNYACIENEIIDKNYDSTQELKTNTLYAFNNVGIIVRNKNVKLWIEDLEKIVSLCDDTTFDSPILKLFDVDFKDEMQVKNILDDPTYEDTRDLPVLFPLPSNDEQFQIVNKVKSSNIVLVQGPPGTGKSHTIANLLSHYVSEGKKVIVTSEKSKALEVLRDKIPEGIRSLSLSLLSNTGIDKDLEFSVDSVLKNQMDEDQQTLVLKDIKKLTDELSSIQNSEREALKQILDLMSKDTVSHRGELNALMGFEETNNLTLMDLAIWLEKNKRFKFVPYNDIENINYPNIKEFFDCLDSIADEIKNNKYALNRRVPIYELINTNEYELAIAESVKFQNYIPKNPELIKAIRQGNLSDESINKLKTNINKMAPLYDIFDKKTLYDYSSYEVFTKSLSKIEDDIKNQHQYIMDTEEKMMGFNIEYPECQREKYHETLKLINEIYGTDDKVALFNKWKFNKLVSELSDLKINGAKISKENINKNLTILACQRLYYDNFVYDTKTKLKQVLNYDLFEKFNINESEFGKYENNIVEILDNILHFRELSDQIDDQFEKIINTNIYEMNYATGNENEINNIMSDLSYYLTVNMNNNNSYKYANDLENYYKDYNLQNIEAVISAIKNNDVNGLMKFKAKLLNEIKIINMYNSLSSAHEQFMRDKSMLINNYIYKYTDDQKRYLKENLDDILKYHFIDKFYNNLEKGETELPKLYDRRKLLIAKEKEVIKELIEKKGWYYQSKCMTAEISFSLNKWMSLKKKIGAGTGKNAQIILRKMREEMAVAKNAIPVWIMPIDKLIEQYPFDNEPPFDVLIMDESSQSSILSVSALARAKKVIIVGDDKQISPTMAFQKLDDINNLRVKYLKNNHWDLQIQNDTSIYDLVQTVCGNKKITLSEHFRCLPEIINFSNKEFYNMGINPLKVRGINETIETPIKEIYVPNAYVKKYGNQSYNEAEVNRIISLIEEMACDSQYDNKTIGVITLQNSSKYIQKIIELCATKFGENFVKDRKIKVGNTYDFQGDERDVIILGMVVAPVNENGERNVVRTLATKEYDRSFNVAASRAKEQMVLVHSVKLEELNPSCNRYKLLDYCMNYKSEKKQEAEKLFESGFERDIYYALDSKGYSLTPQFKVGKYRLDFIVENNNNQKIAIECDGDIYHGLDQLDNDLKRQTILERCGWKFVRVRASEFYYEREKTIARLVLEINTKLNGNISNLNDINLKSENISNYVYDKEFID
jgi:very-short-patch-repair endonuclease